MPIKMKRPRLTILVVEDDPDDRFLIRRAIEANGVSAELRDPPRATTVLLRGLPLQPNRIGDGRDQGRAQEAGAVPLTGTPGEGSKNRFNCLEIQGGIGVKSVGK